MGLSYYMADPHDGHKNIAKFRGRHVPEIVDAESNREYIRKNWRATHEDVVHIVGDVAFTVESILFWNELPGKKKIYLGNHDLENTSRPDINMLASVFDSIYGVTSKTIGPRKVGDYSYPGEKVWIQHIPIHPLHLRGRRQIHGHEHEWFKDHMNPGTDRFDERYINVNMDVLIERTGKIMLHTDELVLYASGRL